MGSHKFWGLRKFWGPKDLGSKNFGLKIFFWSLKFWVQKYLSPKNFRSKEKCLSKNILGKRKFGSEEYFRSENSWVQKPLFCQIQFWVHDIKVWIVYFGSIIFGLAIFRSKNLEENLGPEKFWVWRHFWSGRIWVLTFLGPTKFGVQRNWGYKNCGVQTKFGGQKHLRS